jgi:predicted component of viral defense system (DUF524 family)
MATPVSGANSWLTLNGKPLHFQDDDENLAAQAKENHKNILQITSYAPDDLRISVDDEPIETYRYGRWDWYPKEYAGLYQLQVGAPGYPLLIAKVRVLPSKLSFERYEMMLSDISEIATDLLFSLDSPASERAKAQTRGKQISALRDYHLIQPLVYELGKSIAQIRRNPLRKLQEYPEQRLLHEVHRFSSEATPVAGAVITLPKSVASPYELHALPETWTVIQNTLTYDVYENRLLKHFMLRQLLVRINTIQGRASAELKRREQSRKVKLRSGWVDDETSKIEELENVIEECQKMAKWCIAWGGESYLAQVKLSAASSNATQVLLKNPYYNRFYRLYLQFQQELKISLDTDKYLTELTLRKMSDLYEIWSVFQITEVIKDILIDEDYQITSNGLFYELEQDNFQFDIRRNTASITLEKGELKVALKYEPLYPKFVGGMKGLVSTDYKQLSPDMSVEVYHQNLIKHVIIFDAKYRYEKLDEGFHPKDEDLNKMRKYQALIRYSEYSPGNQVLRPKKIVSSAYILYPGTYIDHDKDEPEIGALPLVPKMDNDDRLDVEDAIKDILWFADLL